MGSPVIDWTKMKLPGQQDKPAAPEAPAAPAQQGIDWTKMKVAGKEAPAPQQTQGGLDWSKMTTTNKAKATSREGDPGFFFRSIAKTATGKSASDLYDQYVSKGLLPKDRQGDWGTRFMVELARGGPEMVDAATSPAGGALIAAHFWPTSRPIALVADSVLGVMQGMRTVPSLWKLGHDFTPENAAIAAKDIFYTYGIIKGSQKKMAKEGIRESQVERAQEGLGKLENLAPKKTDKKPVRLAKERKQDQIWNDLMKPSSSYEKVLQKAYASRFSSLAKILLPPPADVEVGAQLVDEYEINTRTKQYAKKTFLDDMKREVPPEDLLVEKMGYAIQDPAEEKNLSKAGLNWVAKYRQFNLDTVDYMKDAYGDIKLTLQDPETYLAQIWDFDKTAEALGDDPRKQKWFNGVSQRMMKDPFMKPRRAMSKGDGPWNYKEAIEDFGWVPKFKTVPEIINHRWDYLIQTAENQRMARRLRDIKGIVGFTKGMKVGTNWPKATEATPLYRAAYEGKRVGRTTKSGKVTPTTVNTQMKPVFVHPALKHAVDTIFSPGFKFREDLGGGKTRLTTLGALENLRAWSKQSATMASMFHNFAEMSQSMAEQVGNLHPVKALKAVFVADPEYWRVFKNSLYENSGKDGHGNPVPLPLKPEAIMKWLQRGQVFTSTDREEAVVRWMREFEGKNKLTSAISPVVRQFGNVSHAFNKALWDYYLPTQMLNASESIMTRELPRLGPDATPEAIAGLERRVAQHVNRTFGTETLQSLLLDQKSRQLLSALVFAPVWTISNIRTITSGYEDETQQRLRNRWVFGAALSWFISTQLLNRATTSWFSRDKDGKHDWKGRWSWENSGVPTRTFGRTGPSENATGIYVGPNEDGTEAYVRLGKGMAEVFGWMIEPRKELLGKISQPLKVGATMLTGRVPGSDYQAIGYGKDRPDEIMVEQVSEVLSLGAPFWTESFKRLLEHRLAPEAVPEGSPTSFMFLPEKKGLTVTRATEAYAMARERGDTEVMKAILEAAKKNHLRVNTIISNVRRQDTQRRRTAKGPRNPLNWNQQMGFEPLKTTPPPTFEAEP